MGNEHQTAESRLDCERRWLARWWWLFPVGGLFLALAMASWGWAFLQLAPDLIKPIGFSSLNIRYLAVVFGLLIIPVLWLAGIRMEMEFPQMQKKFPLAVLLSLMMVAGAERLVRLPRIQDMLWGSVRARLSAGETEFSMREVSSLRMAVLNPEEKKPGLTFAGSSQMLSNIDFNRLRESTNIPVKRRAVPSTYPLKMLAAQRYFRAGTGDTLIMCLSEFDMYAIGSWGDDWLRPFASWPGTLACLPLLDGRLKREQWRGLCDVFMASTFEWWRIRDGLRHGLFNMMGPSSAAAAGADSGLNQQLERYREGLEGARFYDANCQALEKIVAGANRRGVRVLILEGRINPAMEIPQSQALRNRTRQYLASLARKYTFAFIPVDQQALDLGAEDWTDGTHMSETGRVKNTRYLFVLLRSLQNTFLE